MMKFKASLLITFAFIHFINSNQGIQVNFSCQILITYFFVVVDFEYESNEYLLKEKIVFVDEPQNNNNNYPSSFHLSLNAFNQKFSLNFFKETLNEENSAFTVRLIKVRKFQ